MDESFSKAERICLRQDISALMSKGSWDSAGRLRYCYLYPNGASCSRIMVSVPKKAFRRAVRRNLLKRRIRESYRTQKGLLAIPQGADILFLYNSKELLPYSDIRRDVGRALESISAKIGG